MLPDTDPRVAEAFRKLQERAIPEPDVKESLLSGSSWPQTHIKHQEARKQISERLKLKVQARQFHIFVSDLTLISAI